MQKSSLSPGCIKSNYSNRATLLSESDSDYEYRGAIYQHCSNDILFWINHFCWIYEPRKEYQSKLGYNSPHLLFITWDYQDEYVKWLCEHINNGTDGLTEKSRDMGMSWLVSTVFLWYWLFGKSGNDFLIGSRKQEFVDKHGAMDAVFPKIRYNLYRQPEWFMPQGWNKLNHDTFMRLINPKTGSYIKGEANNKYFGTGGRYKAVLLDEFAKWEHTDELAWQSLSDATPCRLPVSSAFGRNNMFYKLASHSIGEIDKTRISWKLHPLKTKLWYDAEKKRRSPQDLAAEVDIDYTASISEKAYEAFNYENHTTTDNLYDSHLSINFMCDFNVDPMCWTIGHEHKGNILMFDEYAERVTDTGTVISKFCKDYKTHSNKIIYVYGDATGKRKDTRSKSSDYTIIKNVLQRNGWQVIMQVPLSNPPVKTRINAVNKRLYDWENDGKSWVLISQSNCKVLIDSLEQTRRKDDGIDKSDNVEHMTDGFGYYITHKFPVIERKIRGAAW